MAYRDVVISDGAIAYWRLDELGGTTAADQVAPTSAGTYTSTGVTFGVPGALIGDADTAITLNGTNGHVSIPNAPKFDTPVSNQWTIEAWVKPTSTSGVNDVIRKASDGSAFFLRINNGVLEALFSPAGTFAGGAVSAGAWQHVVAVYDGSGGHATLYVNGVQTATGAVTATLAFSSQSLAIGQAGPFAGEFFNGSIDEVALYNTALSATQVTNHYETGTVTGPSAQTAGQSLGVSWTTAGVSNALFSYADVPFGSTSTLLQDLSPGLKYQIGVAAYDTAGQSQGFSVLTTVQTSGDTIAPSTPAAPAVAGNLLSIQVIHTLGKASGGTYNLDVDLNHLEVYVSTTGSGFTPDQSTFVGTLTANIGMMSKGIPAIGTFVAVDSGTRWVKVVAVDNSGNRSAASTSTSVAATLIQSANIGTAVISTANIGDLAVTSAKIASLSVSKLTAGTLLADVVVSARIKTADTGARLEVNSGGLFAYNGSNTQTVKIGSDGTAVFTGTISGSTITGGTVSGTTLTGTSLFGSDFYTNNSTPRVHVGANAHDHAGNPALVYEMNTAAGLQAWVSSDANRPLYLSSGGTNYTSAISLFGDDGGVPNYGVQVRGYSAILLDPGVSGGGNYVNIDGDLVVTNSAGNPTTLWLSGYSNSAYSIAVDTTSGTTTYNSQFGHSFATTTGGTATRLSVGTGGVGVTGVITASAQISSSTFLSGTYLTSSSGYGFVRGQLSGNTGAAGPLVSFWTNVANPTTSLAFELNGTAVKTFVIDHPQRPAEQYLVHAVVEGPENAVFYRGRATLVGGQAEVILPEYFEALTVPGSATVLLTPVASCDEPLCENPNVPYLVTTDVTAGRFTVSEGGGYMHPCAAFFWQVMATRADVPALVVELDRSSVDVVGDGPYTYTRPKATT